MPCVKNKHLEHTCEIAVTDDELGTLFNEKFSILVLPFWGRHFKII